ARAHAGAAHRGAFGGDASAAAVPHYGGREDERFSADAAWMPRTVMVAKTTPVWLDQLARAHGRAIARLDQVPDDELARLAAFGINALWLIGVWERSRASRRIKERTGQPDAAASAYSLHDYAIAADLGGEAAWAGLRDRAAAHGIRLASDMVPNHMGLDSPWLLEHPEWFLSRPDCPYPSYRFEGPDLADDPRVEIRLEDHYYDRSDAAVVFRRRDRGSGEVRYVYHGNDGTGFPWNDTAQLDYLNPATRERVIRAILDVARRFPIVRFDAAMTLTRRHVRRLWYPEPGDGGAVPSRAGHGLSRADFDARLPHEFWREVVDRVAVEAPGTLLLAEAFWLLEGYFVRTLGMHRVYNSAFMNMLRDEQNANYRSVLRNTLEFDPEILQRWVNFMSNPDERPAADQFGRGGKYFGVCTLLATLPGLPMFAHGQLEGFEERYGMEFRRALRAETPDAGLLAEHARRIAPLLHRRELFAGAREFLLYDCVADGGGVNEDVFAYSNRAGGEAALVLYHNRFAEARGWIRDSVAYAGRRDDGSRPLTRRGLAEGLGLPAGDPLVRCRDLGSGREWLLRAAALRERGLRVELGAYEARVLLDWRLVHEDERPWRELERRLAGAGCDDLEEALWRVAIEPAQAS
ncbi:MAG TPA: alpha-amylase family glycosyl hydrolase, partial [Candidatus Eisenbacteria bacterium]|nr:alpha-amylase family glycosyl hydrolase [Candidatus Eisenbacteria bacterium]